MIRISSLLCYERLDERTPYWFINQVNLQIQNIDVIIINLNVSSNHFVRYNECNFSPYA